MMSAKECILEEIKTFPGQSGIYYQNLETGETWGYGEKDHYLAASIVKLPLMAAILLWKSRGETSFDDTVTIRENQKIPGCGAVQFLNGDVTLTVGELCKLMIVISDSCATNALFRHYGAAAIHDAFLELGLIGTQFNREYWDEEREKRGINNYFVPEEMGRLLQRMYDRTLVDEESSAWLESILRQQQINHKLGGKLPMDFPMAHKTGDEEDKAHDVGIVFTKSPFIACFAYVGPDMQVYEDFIRRAARMLADENGGVEI
ncbi:serine hydrolase [uncultured Oscillibacter sp.]|uniref:serine hydrolase n=1 Tax=uncultured Oscillibacter sp. TaxID=876091 RepID=UPI0025D2A785|nr:serine hydrolase [uncultured Oscillibacter sp.]